MTNKTKVIAAITIVLIAAGSVFFLSGTDLMGRMKFSSPKAYDEGRHTDYKKSVADSNCNNGIDDDGDTQIDGNDPECKYAWSNEKDYNPPPRNPDPVEDPDEPEEPVETQSQIRNQRNLHTQSLSDQMKVFFLVNRHFLLKTEKKDDIY